MAGIFLGIAGGAPLNYTIQELTSRGQCGLRERVPQRSGATILENKYRYGFILS